MNIFLISDDGFALRMLVGFAVALGVAVAAYRRGSLTISGAAAAVAVGTVSVSAGYSWGALLIAFFVSATALSQNRADEKARRTGGVIEKAGARDALQVLANGAVFAIAAAAIKVVWGLKLGTMDSLPAWTWMWTAIGGGAIATACADTWSTEIGTLSDAPPRLITTRAVVPPGTSGGVTARGLGATVAGACFIGVLAWAVRWPATLAVATAGGGIIGALADSLLGATVQGRRRCPQCGVATERLVHDCGTETVAAGGLAWLDNDLVNLLSTGIGALAAAAIASAFV
jgi:uncharacterized protein (TIGR00297 family)